MNSKKKFMRRVVTVLLLALLVFGEPAAMVILASEEDTQTQEPVEVDAPTEELIIEETPPDATQSENQEEESSETPDDGVSIENETSVENDIETTSNTGGNEIVEEPQEEFEEKIEEELPECAEGEEEGEALECELLSDGDEQAEEPVGEQVSDEKSTEVAAVETSEENNEPNVVVIETSDSVSDVQIENEVNTTEIDSQVLMRTLNIYLADDINLSIDPGQIAEEVLSANTKDPVVNVSVYEGSNYVVLTNDVISVANTGSNAIGGVDKAVIDTGDAYSLVSLLNKVNTTVIGSDIHIVTINIYGVTEGDILLPEFDREDGDGCCMDMVIASNSAELINDVVSDANTGDNQIMSSLGEGEASIETGDAASAVNVVNIVNTTLVNTVFRYLYINLFGEWSGDFVGWDDLSESEGGRNLYMSSVDGQLPMSTCSGCVDGVNQSNSAVITNNITTYSNTGENLAYAGDANIETGNAYSVVSLINLINSTIINSKGFIGFINIFGTLKGDIGGVSEFSIEKSDDDGAAVGGVSSNDDESTRESGGELELYQSNNVNDHVYPGDTVMFFLKAKNVGTGKVYEPKLILDLVKDGVSVGGVEFDLEDIESGKGFKISTGLVLSDEIEPGQYIAHARIEGKVGPDDTWISAYADSFFDVAGVTYVSAYTDNGLVEEVKAAETPGEILGGYTYKDTMTTREKLIYLFVALVLFYTASKAYQNKEGIIKRANKATLFIKSKISS
ncbi:hypothetical protein ACFL2C_00550 [Patescibacteria group bacterium]